MPDIKLREEIRAIKEEFSRDFFASHALRSPAHITLQMPFKRTPDHEPLMISALKEFSAGEKPFTVDLDGFGAFVPRVIFIKISDHQQISGLHLRLSDVLITQMGFSRDDMIDNVHPHITIATRDLSRDSFGRAWPLFENRKFTGSFKVDSLFLLKHNSRRWEILREFNFSPQVRYLF